MKQFRAWPVRLRNSMMADIPTGTVTFLFTDIEGSTRLWEEHPDAMRTALIQHDDLLRACIGSHGGHVFKTVGDAFCAVFANPREAVETVIASQQWLPALALRTPDGSRPLKVRMSLHTGVVEEREGDYFGQPLNRVARLLAIGHGGQVLLSAATQELVRDHLPPGVSLTELGEHRLKDVGRPETVFQLRHPDLAADFPPLRSLDNPALKQNLPLQMTSFIGRERELAEVKALLEKARLLTLTGSGGCGKARHALRAAADLLDDREDGAWLVELAPLAEPELVPQAVAAVLGVKEEAGKSLQETLTHHLWNSSLLLVLDNCEHLLNASAQLADAILRYCPRVRILATSREALGIMGEQAYRVPSLSVPEPGRPETLETLDRYEAARLFVDRALLHNPAFVVTDQNVPAVASICYRLDGIPLAIELAAARVRSMSLEEVNLRLDQRFRLLTGGSRTALPRQQTLRSLIDWSYGLLQESERALLCRLSVFSGGWTLEAAEAVCGEDGATVEDGRRATRAADADARVVGRLPPFVPRTEVLDLLTSLVDKSLVMTEGAGESTRYRFLETVRQYAGERLAECGEADRWRDRHCEWCLALAEGAAQHLYRAGQAAWQQRLGTDYDNLRAAMNWSVSSPTRKEAALRLVGALTQFWVMGSYQREAREWIRTALAGSRNASPLVLARALEAKCYSELDTGDYDAAASIAREWVDVARAAGDRWQTAYALFGTGIVAIQQWVLKAAHACAAEGAMLSREEGDPWLIGRFLSVRGLIAWMEHDFRAARGLIGESVSISRALGDEWHLGMVLCNLACVTRLDGDYEEAHQLHREGLGLFGRLGDRRGAAFHLAGLAGAELERGSADRAARLLGAGASLMEAIGAPYTPVTQIDHDRTLALARAILGTESFGTAHAQGRALTLEEAVAYALGEEAFAALWAEGAAFSLEQATADALGEEG